MITDRIKNLIVLDNGKKVSPTPMETKLAGSPYIAQAVIIGDGHASTGALVVPDFDRLDAWAREAGLEPTDTATTVEIAEVITLIEAEMRRLLREEETFLLWGDAGQMAILSVWHRRADLDAMLASGEEPFARRLIRGAGATPEVSIYEIVVRATSATG